MVYATLGAVTLLGVGAWFFLLAGDGGSSKPATVAPASPPSVAVPLIPPAPPAVLSPVPSPPAPAPRVYWTAAELGAFDPARFDAEAFVPRALAKARTLFADATIVWFSAVDVGADGLCDLTTGSGRAVSYAFRRAGSTDAGGGCLHWVYVDEKGASDEPDTGRSARLCALSPALLAKRRCTLAQALARVAAKNPPRAGRTHVMRWSFDTLTNGKVRADWSVSGFPTVSDNDAATDLSWGFPDDCAAAKP